jgi:hypothetical protein
LAVAVIVAVPFEAVTLLLDESTALAPEDGAGKVTVTPPSGLPKGSFTVTFKGFAKAFPTTADCDPPEVAVTLPPLKPCTS